VISQKVNQTSNKTTSELRARHARVGAILLYHMDQLKLNLPLYDQCSCNTHCARHHPVDCLALDRQNQRSRKLVESLNHEHLSPDGQFELTVLCYSHILIHIFEDNSPQSHLVLCWVTNEDTHLAARQGCFSLPPLTTSASASDSRFGLIIYIDAQPLESARWHRQQHVCAIQ